MTSLIIKQDLKSSVSRSSLSYEISPVGILQLSARGIVQDAISVLSIGEDLNDKDAEERRRRELLLDNNERILQVIYGYKNGTEEGASESDSDCESDYEDDDEE